MVFKHSTVARTSFFWNNNNKSQIIVGYPISYRLKNIKGVLDHEIGTHYLRKIND